MTRSPDYYILWLLVISLIAGNVWAGFELYEAKKNIAVFLENIAMTVTEVGSSELPYNIDINQKIPFSAEVDLKDGLRVPVKTVVPINTIVDVPISIPVIGNTTVRVPINTTVPINLTLDLKLEKNIPVQGETNLSLEVPIQIKSTPLGAALEQVAKELRELQNHLAQ